MSDNSVNEKLETIFQGAFGVDKLTDDMSIKTVEGWDSMAHVALIMTLQKEFNIAIAPQQAIELIDVSSIKNFLNSK